MTEREKVVLLEKLRVFFTKNIDLNGRVILNAGSSSDLSSYVTKGELNALVEHPEVINDILELDGYSGTSDTFLSGDASFRVVRDRGLEPVIADGEFVTLNDDILMAVVVI